jgi:hypothetical protein
MATAMTEVLDHLAVTIDRQNPHETAATRRQLVKGAAAALGSAGLLGLATGDDPAAAAIHTNQANSVETIGKVAATGEVLATIVNTVGAERLASRLDPVTLRNVRAAAQQEKNHYEVLTSNAVGATPATTTIYVPDEVFSSPQAFLETLVVGDQVFVNAYLIGITVFARQGTLTGSRFARYAAEIMGVEAVHRALALQSLGRLGNDRAYCKFAQREDVPGLPTSKQPGFYRVQDAVTILEEAGFGFGKPGSKPGTAYTYADVAARTPVDPDVNTILPS